MLSFFSNIAPAKPTYDPVKLRPLLKMGITRLRLVQGKRRNELVKQRRELGELLRQGNIAGCRVRVEGVMREESAIGGFEILAMMTDLVSSRLPTITNAGASCPAEMKEAVTSVLWAAPFVGTHVPEFNGIRTQFAAKFSQSFVESAVKNTELSVHEQLRASFDPVAPSEIRCVKYMESICSEFCIPIDAELFHSGGLGSRTAGEKGDEDEEDVSEGDSNAGFHVQGYWIPHITVPRDDMESKLLALKRAWA